MLTIREAREEKGSFPLFRSAKVYRRALGPSDAQVLTTGVDGMMHSNPLPPPRRRLHLAASSVLQLFIPIRLSTSMAVEFAIGGLVAVFTAPRAEALVARRARL